MTEPPNGRNDIAQAARALQTSDLPPFAEVAKQARRRRRAVAAAMLAGVGALAVMGFVVVQVAGTGGDGPPSRPHVIGQPPKLTITVINPTKSDSSATVEKVSGRTTEQLATEFRDEFYGGALLSDGPHYYFKDKAPAQALTIIEAAGIRVTVAEGLGISLPEAIAQENRLGQKLIARGINCTLMPPLLSDLSWHVSCNPQADMDVVRELAPQELKVLPIVFEESSDDPTTA